MNGLTTIAALPRAAGAMASLPAEVETLPPSDRDHLDLLDEISRRSIEAAPPEWRARFEKAINAAAAVVAKEIEDEMLIMLGVKPRK